MFVTVICRESKIMLDKLCKILTIFASDGGISSFWKAFKLSNLTETTDSANTQYFYFTKADHHHKWRNFNSNTGKEMVWT
jgi:hypothetical protein